MYIDLVNSVTQMIRKIRTKIIGVFEHNGLIIKWFQKPERRDGNEMVLKLFK